MNDLISEFEQASIDTLSHQLQQALKSIRLYQKQTDIILKKIYNPKIPDRERIILDGQLIDYGQINEKATLLIDSLLTEAAIRTGLPPKAPEGYVRIYRGTEWPWNHKKYNWDNAYWTEKFETALIYAHHGDIVVCDVPEEFIYRVQDEKKKDEFQIPDKNTTKNAKVIFRNQQFRDKKGNLPRTSFRSSIFFGLLTGNKHMEPKKYAYLHDEWIRNHRPEQ